MIPFLHGSCLCRGVVGYRDVPTSRAQGAFQLGRIRLCYRNPSGSLTLSRTEHPAVAESDDSDRLGAWLRRNSSGQDKREREDRPISHDLRHTFRADIRQNPGGPGARIALLTESGNGVLRGQEAIEAGCRLPALGDRARMIQIPVVMIGTRGRGR
jgi:hypothetical protein